MPLKNEMFEHEDVLRELNTNIPLQQKLQYIHDLLRKKFDFIARIAATIYDPKTDLLKTFAYSSEEETPLAHYQAKLADSGPLTEILKKGRPRVVNDLEVYSKNIHRVCTSISGSLDFPC